jgi:hypothetical protein
MSFLAPLFLLAGLAVSLPVLLHLIRRTPRGKLTFSSLMFLSPSPPRITRRSRIEHWLLLALRAAVILLLAMAFARPFVRASASLLLDRGPGRQVAILIDTSASMRRAGLWRQAVSQAQKALTELGPKDIAALYQFDSTVRAVVDFPDQTVDRTAQLALLRTALGELAPTWRATNLGRALTTLADSLSASRRERGDDHPGQIVIISDLQQGADLAALQGYEWPGEVTVLTRPVTPAKTSNAAVRLLNDTGEAGVRARISNAADSAVEEFRLGWYSKTGGLQAPTSVYVPAGQVRVVKLAERPPGTDRLRLVGDEHDFDNDFFVGPVIQQQFSVLFLGNDQPDDPSSLRYFLARVWAETPRRKVTVQYQSPQQPLLLHPGQHFDLIVSLGVSQSQREPLRTFSESGGVVLLLGADPASSQDVANFLSGVKLASVNTEPPHAVRTDRNSFALLTEIDFTHPVFASFADPRFGDFTKIRFWNHGRFELDSGGAARVLARFDDGVPALWEQPLGNGRVFVLSSTWRPSDSQLALSSKFVPLLSSLLTEAAGIGSEPSTSLVVGSPLPLPDSEKGLAPVVRGPDETQWKLAEHERTFAATELPGTYQIQLGQVSPTVAVNLASAESDTVPLAADRLEQLGVRLGSQPTQEERVDRERQLRDIELESRQKVWQWLIVMAIAVLGVETLVAGRATREQETRGETTELT